jgi:hypothetical protein
MPLPLMRCIAADDCHACYLRHIADTPLSPCRFSFDASFQRFLHAFGPAPMLLIFAIEFSLSS